MNILHGTTSQPVNRPEPYFYDRVVYTTTGAVVDIEDFENRPLYPETVSISGVSTITETGTYTFTNDINVDSFTEPIKSVTWTNADKIDNNSASITVNSLPSADQTVTISCEIEFEKGYTKTISKQVTIVEGPYTPSISSMTIDGTSIASGDTLSAGGLFWFYATISEYRSNHTVSILLKQSGETVLTLGTFSSTSVNTANSTTLENGSYSIVFVVDGDSTEYATVTISTILTHAGYEYVDLGLPSGTKWAKYNVGATSETEYGNYYMYGKGASLYNGSDSAYSGTEDPLNSSVDTARQVWGGMWHMPTRTQCTELVTNTTYEWTTINGVNGGKFTAQNGNYIFIPAAGYYSKGSLNSAVSYVWSSTPDSSTYAYFLNPSNIGSAVSEGGYRLGGYSVRPVYNG